MKRALRSILSLALPALLVAGYWFFTHNGEHMYFPSMRHIATAFLQTWTGEGFTTNVLPSLANLGRGFVLGFTFGVAGGIVIGRTAWLRHVLAPLVSFQLTLPPVALFPLFLIAFGIGPALQVGMIAFSVFIYALVTVSEAVRNIDAVVLDVSTVFRLPLRTRLVSIYVPAIVPTLISTARITLATGLLVMVVSEMVGASRGIGAVILLAQQSFDYSNMWAGMILVAGFGIAINLAFIATERVVLRVAGYTTTQEKGTA